MRGRHSIEIKTLLEQSNHKMNKENRDSDSSLTAYSHNHSHTLKSSDSSSTLANTQSQVSVIQDRLHTIKEDYNKLQKKVALTTPIYEKQKE